MCTLSWLQADNGYELFFNRDEKHTRQRALPPAAHDREGVACLYPVDPDGGGTWLAVSARGLTAALLNYYPDETTAPGPGRRSRGQVVLHVLASVGAQAAIARAAALPLGDYPPFMLAAIEPGEPLLVATWDGRTYRRIDPAPAVLSTSSFETAAVVTSRLQCFARMRDASGSMTAAMHSRFHASHDPTRSPHSVCMHREDASTVSHGHVTVDASSIRFDYTDGAPCGQAPRVTLSIGRKR